MPELKFFKPELMRLLELDPMRGHTFSFVVDAIIQASSSSVSGVKRYALPKELLNWVCGLNKGYGFHSYNCYSKSDLMCIVRDSQIKAPCDYVVVNHMTTNEVESITVPV